MDANFLPSITTTNKDITKFQLKELSDHKQKQFGLFITGLKKADERMDFLKSLKSYKIKFPFVHIRIDSTVEEVEFCLDNFETEWFNLHGDHYKKLENSELFQFKNYILAENSRTLTITQMQNFAGICLDLSHYYEDCVNEQEHFEDVQYTTSKFPVIVNHISAIKVNKDVWSEHIGNYNEDFDYLNKIPKELFGSDYSCLELENTIESQLKFIKYIKKL
jgi:hypothetical protein